MLVRTFPKCHLGTFIEFISQLKGTKAILQTIKTKDAVNQNVLVEVGCSFFTFLIISTRLIQNIIAKIGITYTFINANTIIRKHSPQK